jgi:hypothetical protein
MIGFQTARPIALQCQFQTSHMFPPLLGKLGNRENRNLVPAVVRKVMNGAKKTRAADADGHHLISITAQVSNWSR